MTSADFSRLAGRVMNAPYFYARPHFVSLEERFQWEDKRNAEMAFLRDSLDGCDSQEALPAKARAIFARALATLTPKGDAPDDPARYAEDQPRETGSHDGKKPGEFAPAKSQSDGQQPLTDGGKAGTIPSGGKESKPEGGKMKRPNPIAEQQTRKLEAGYVEPAKGRPKLAADLSTETEEALRSAIDWHVARANATNGKLMAADARIDSLSELGRIGQEMRCRVLRKRGFSEEQVADALARNLDNADLPEPEDKG